MREKDHRKCAHSIKKGHYIRKRDRRWIQRYYCKTCKVHYSKQTYHYTYREKRPDINRILLRLLCSGLSQRRAAEILKIHPITVARKISRLAVYSKKKNAQDLKAKKKVESWIFDEMETFEHTKCKPVSIALAVEEKTRRILNIEVAQMPAKGLLAKVSREKYGRRKDMRPKMFHRFFSKLQKTCSVQGKIKSDQNPHYQKHVRRFFPKSFYQQFKGRRGCIVGQG